MGPPIKKLEFEKDTLGPHNIIGGKCSAEATELCKDCTEPLQEDGVHNCGGDFVSTAKNSTRQETRKYVENIRKID